MATTAKKAERADTTLEIRRTIPAPRERVFDAWTQAKELNRWSAPSPMTPSARGRSPRRWALSHRYARTRMASERRVGGVYRTIDRPSKLVYTWKWEESPMPDSVVTVEFHERGKQTEVVLRHEGLTDPESRGRHEHGWTACLDNLVTIMKQ